MTDEEADRARWERFWSEPWVRRDPLTMEPEP